MIEIKKVQGNDINFINIQEDINLRFKQIQENLNQKLKNNKESLKKQEEYINSKMCTKEAFDMSQLTQRDYNQQNSKKLGEVEKKTDNTKFIIKFERHFGVGR